MSKLFSNKKLMLGIVSVMVGVTILMAGLTYAWFTNSGTAVRDDITMGTLKMNVTLANPDLFGFDEPGGLRPNQIAYIQNLGTVMTLAKLKFTTTTTIKSDSNGDPLSSWYTIENDPKVQVILQEDGHYGNLLPGTRPDGLPLCYWFSENGEIYSWIKYKGEYYVNMGVTTNEDGVHPKPGEAWIIPFLYTVDLSKEMGNEYQNADVNIKVEWIATQSFADESFAELFGIDEADVLGFVNDFALGAAQPPIKPLKYVYIEDYLS